MLGLDWIRLHTIDWIRIHGMDWVAFGSIATAVGVFIAAVGVFIAASGIRRTIRAQGEIANESNRISNSWRLLEYWESARMLEYRVDAARAITLCGHDADILDALNDIIDVLNFFEHLGYLLNRKWIDIETAYVLFADWGLPYWRVAAKYIEKDREEDPTAWADFEYLYKRLCEWENRERQQAGRPAYGETDDEFAKEERELLRGESNLLPARPLKDCRSLAELRRQPFR